MIATAVSAHTADLLAAFGLTPKDHVTSVHLAVDINEIVTATITRHINDIDFEVFVKTLSLASRRTKLVPAIYRQVSFTYLAPAAVLRVFDTAGDGTLQQVAFRLNPCDAIEFNLEHAAHGQIYAEVFA